MKKVSFREGCRGVCVLFGAAILLDQATKIFVRHTMSLGTSIPVLGHVLRITYVENPGIAFGIRVNNGTLFTVLSVLASVGVAVYLFTHWNEGMGVKGSLALILGGALGNLMDRILYQRVVDFIDVGIRDLRWPVFNIADSCVVIGMFLLFFSFFISDQRKEKEKQEGIQKAE